MTDTAKVRVELDTSQAKAELTKMTRDAQTAGSRVGERVRDSVGRGIRAVGAGAAAGVGFAAARGVAGSGLGDIVGDQLSSVGASLEGFLFGDAASEARATHRARQEFIQNFGRITGPGPVPPAMVELFNQRVDLLTQEEEGRRILREQLPNADIGNLVERLIDSITKAIQEAGDRIVENMFKIGG